MNLKEGEMMCDKCDGKRFTLSDTMFPILCSKCNGEGKVDWIENITGKPVMTQSEIDSKTVDLLVFLYYHT